VVGTPEPVFSARRKTMSEYDTAEIEGTDIEPRDVRALTEYHSVLDEIGRARGADDLYLVVSESGSEYLVDARLGSCECPDHTHREVRCKHIRRVAYATGDRPVPAGVDTDAVDPQLGMHVDATPRVAATDGGADIIDAGDEGEVLDEDDTDTDDVADGGRPDDCDCGAWNAGEDLPCWPCARDGFEEPASADD
jgi:hypothetical protein